MLPFAFLIVVTLTDPGVVAERCPEDSPWWCATRLNENTCQIFINDQLNLGLQAEMEFQLRIQCEEMFRGR